MSGSVASSEGRVPFGAWGNLLPNASPSSPPPPDLGASATSASPPSRAGDLSGLAMSVNGAPFSADVRLSPSEADARRDLEGSAGVTSSGVLDQRAEQALEGVRSENGRTLYRDGFPMNGDGVARLVADQSGLNASELLRVDGEKVAESLMRQGAILPRNQSDIEAQILQAPALRVAMETREATLDALRVADSKIANAQSEVARLQSRLSDGGTVSRGDLIRALDGSGIRAQDLERLGLEEGRVTERTLSQAQRSLRSFADASERMQSTYSNVLFSERTMLADARFENVRDSVMAREGVSFEKPEFQRSVDALGQPLDMRQVIDDAAAIASKVPGVGSAVSAIWSGTTAIMDVALSPTKEAEARVLYAAGIVDDPFVEDASQAATRTLFRTAVSTFAGRTGKAEVEASVHMMMRNGDSPFSPRRQ